MGTRSIAQSKDGVRDADRIGIFKRRLYQTVEWLLVFVSGCCEILFNIQLISKI